MQNDNFSLYNNNPLDIKIGFKEGESGECFSSFMLVAYEESRNGQEIVKYSFPSFQVFPKKMRIKNLYSICFKTSSYAIMQLQEVETKDEKLCVYRLYYPCEKCPDGEVVFFSQVCDLQLCEIIPNSKKTAAYLLVRGEVGAVFKLSEDKEKPEPVDFIEEDLAHPFYHVMADVGAEHLRSARTVDGEPMKFVFKIQRPLLFAKMFIISKRQFEEIPFVIIPTIGQNVYLFQPARSQLHMLKANLNFKDKHQYTLIEQQQLADSVDEKFSSYETDATQWILSNEYGTVLQVVIKIQEGIVELQTIRLKEKLSEGTRWKFKGDSHEGGQNKVFATLGQEIFELEE